MRDPHRRHLAYEVDRLHRAGRSQRQIARTFMIGRKKVRTLLRELAQKRVEGESAVTREIPVTATRASRLDEFEDKIREWLREEKADRKSRKGSKLTAVRCHEKLLDEGFTGGYTIVRERLKKLRLEMDPPRPSATPREFPPGQRGEFDWSPYDLGNGVEVRLFHAVLCWSRAPALYGMEDMRQTTTLNCIAGALHAKWGGVPEELITDTMAGLVDRWELEEPILNVRYVDFAAYYGFTALVARRRTPTDKPLAERRYRYHQDNLLSGRKFASVAEFVEALAWWEREKVLARDHPESRRPVLSMLELERAHLRPLPARPYDTRDVFVRLVNDYQRVPLDTNEYPASAPVGSRVYLLASADRVQIVDPRARILDEHERLPAGARIKLPPRHARRARYDLDELTERVGLWGEVVAAFAKQVRAKRRYAGAELARLLQLAVHWSADDIVAAVEQAMEYGCFEVGKVMRILEMRFTPRHFEELIAERTRRRIEQVMDEQPVTGRPLTSYEAFKTGDCPRNEETRDDEEE